MIYFVVFASFLVGSLVPVHADEAEINGPECGIFTSRLQIVNGSIARRNQFPWTVFLTIKTRNHEVYVCGGSIFTSRHVLTAAHCLTYESGDPTGVDVIYGNNDYRRGKTVKVKKWIRHSKYNSHTFAQDIAVLLVEKPFKFAGNVKPVCIPAVPMDNYNADTVVAGWGSLKEGGKQLSHQLRFTTVKILPNERCSKVYHGSYNKKVMYCAYEEGKDSCAGDSGGPLMTLGNGRRYVQVGIVSFGIGCARINTPGVYTRVDAFIPWLKQVVHSLRSSDKAYSEQVPLQLASYTVPQWPYFSVPL